MRCLIIFILCICLSDSNSLPICHDKTVIVNSGFPYHGLNGANDRLIDLLNAFLVDLQMQVLMIYETENKKLSALQAFKHENLVSVRLPPKTKASAVETMLSKSPAFQSFQQSDSAPCSIPVFSFVWAWRPSFIDLWKSIWDTFESSFASHSVVWYSIYDDDCLARLDAENSNNPALLRQEKACAAAARFRFLTGVIGISLPVCHAMGNITKSPGCKAVFPFTYSLPVFSSSLPFNQRTVDFLFMANDNPANRMSLQWLCSHFVPHLPENVQLHVYGKVAGDQAVTWAGCDVSSLANRISLHSWVSDEELTNVLHHAKIFVAPVLVPTGVSTKVVRAIAYGIPTITTPAGAEGIEHSLKSCRESPVAIKKLDEFTVTAKHLLENEKEWESFQRVSIPCARLAFSRGRLAQAVKTLID